MARDGETDRGKKSNAGRGRQIGREGRGKQRRGGGEKNAKIFISLVTKGNLSFSTSSLSHTLSHTHIRI